jgi:hypothetical protein
MRKLIGQVNNATQCVRVGSVEEILSRVMMVLNHASVKYRNPPVFEDPPAHIGVVKTDGIPFGPIEGNTLLDCARHDRPIAVLHVTAKEYLANIVEQPRDKGLLRVHRGNYPAGQFSRPNSGADTVQPQSPQIQAIVDLMIGKEVQRRNAESDPAKDGISQLGKGGPQGCDVPAPSIVRGIGSLENHSGKGGVQFDHLGHVLDRSVGAQGLLDCFEGDHGKGGQGLKPLEAMTEIYLIGGVRTHGGQTFPTGKTIVW